MEELLAKYPPVLVIYTPHVLSSEGMKRWTAQVQERIPEYKVLIIEEADSSRAEIISLLGSSIPNEKLSELMTGLFTIKGSDLSLAIDRPRGGRERADG